MALLHLYAADREIAVADAPGLLRSLRDDDGAFGWIDLTVDESAMLAELADELQLHELAVEDALSAVERPKIARYSTHLLMTLSSSSIAADGEVQLQRFTAFLLPNLLITVTEEGFPAHELRGRLAANRDLVPHGVAFLLWGVLDVVVDDHVTTLEELDEHCEALAAELFGDHRRTVDVQQRAFALRRSVMRMQRATLPLREVVNTLTRRDLSVSVRGLEPYFADVYDHTLHAAEWSEMLRDQISTILETNVALQGNAMNEIMKKVTSWAAIIAVPTAITGYFGQNLQFPGFGTEPAWWVSNAIIVVLGAGLYALFRRFDWL